MCNANRHPKAVNSGKVVGWIVGGIEGWLAACYYARVQLRTSIKLIKLGYFACLLLALGIAAYLLATHNQDNRTWAWLAIPALGALYLVVRHIQRRSIRLTILADRLRYEAGLLSKTTRTMELAKVQDVRVDQSLFQRMLDIGDLSLETAGETSRIVMLSIDRPHDAASKILELSGAKSPAIGSKSSPQP